jgi:hypothetical protein
MALAASLMLLTSVPGSGAEQATAGISAEAKTQAVAKTEGVIAVPEVATRATEVADIIRNSTAKLAAGAGIKAISESLPNAAKLIDLEASVTAQLLRQQPTLDSLERQQLLWQQRQIVTTSWLNALTERASLLQDVLNRLSELSKTWTATRAAAQAANAPEPILQQIDDTLATLAAEETPVHSQRTAVLDLQARVALLGVDLSKITVLAGAFSVGIGFGLQSIVNNFVSGLIVLFERPIDKGDSVEIGNLRGTVQHIGIRASVVRTFQGADIIVPNSQFIAEKVTNWTHGDRSMRIELPVGVNYATSPKKAIGVLEATARAHPEVLRERRLKSSLSASETAQSTSK